MIQKCIHLLNNGDCLEVMKGLADKSVDAIITDPPYGTTACKWDAVIPFAPMWEQLKRIAKDRAAVVLFGSQPFTSALVMSNPKMFRYCWVWDKRYSSNYPLAKKQPMKRHEDLVVFGSSKAYTPIKTMRDTPIKKGANTGAKVFNSGLEKEGWQGKEYFDKYPESIIYFSNRELEKRIHPTQKPVALLEYLIKTYTQEGETVLDFTMGSGTTGVACANTNRNFIGIELDANYFEIAQKRIRDAYMKPRQLKLAA